MVEGTLERTSPSWRERVRRLFAWLTVLALALGFLGVARVEQTACRQRQALYDGQFSYTRFLAKEVGATKVQTRKALVDLRDTVGPRPSC